MLNGGNCEYIGTLQGHKLKENAADFPCMQIHKQKTEFSTTELSLCLFSYSLSSLLYLSRYLSGLHRHAYKYTESLHIFFLAPCNTSVQDPLHYLFICLPVSEGY